MRASGEKYRVLLDESSDPIFSFFPDGRYFYVNRAFADGVGRLQAEIIGRSIWDVFPRDEADKRFAVVKWVFEHGASKVIEVRVTHPDGDLLLQEAARRIGGDEFVVLLPSIATEQDALVVAEKLRDALAGGFALAGYPPLHVSASIGIAIHPDHGDDAIGLLKNADDAMYRAKAEGRNLVRLCRSA